MDELPDVCFNHICSFIPGSDRLRLQVLNQRFKNMAPRIDGIVRASAFGLYKVPVLRYNGMIFYIFYLGDRDNNGKKVFDLGWFLSYNTKTVALRVDISQCNQWLDAEVMEIPPVIRYILLKRTHDLTDKYLPDFNSITRFGSSGYLTNTQTVDENGTNI